MRNRYQTYWTESVFQNIEPSSFQVLILQKNPTIQSLSIYTLCPHVLVRASHSIALNGYPKERLAELIKMGTRSSNDKGNGSEILRTWFHHFRTVFK